jgi:hypothetical protein
MLVLQVFQIHEKLKERIEKDERKIEIEMT